MSAAPFDVQPVIARLREQVSVLRKVAGAADYATVRSLGDFQPPCAYVLLAREKAETHPPGNGLPGQLASTTQRVTVSFGVVMAVRNYRESGSGAQSADELHEVIGAVRAVLLGWVPHTPGARPCALMQGDLNQYDRGTSLWTDVYQTQHIIRSPT